MAKKSKKASKKHCKGIVKSGKKKGKLKTGYKFKKGHACPVKAKKGKK
jgi:hypothetical protein